MENIRTLLGFEGMIAIDAQGHSGGITVLWRNKNEVYIRSLSKNHIDLDILIQGWPKFRLTSTYGEPDRVKRQETLQLIRTLAIIDDLPWVMTGDMNNVLSHRDKSGGRLYPSWLIREFVEVLNYVNLVDMELVGYPYVSVLCPKDNTIVISGILR